MVGVSTSSSPADMSYIRKIRKPMVEKRRRERMNTSINQLKSLIAQTIKHNTAPMTRVDKADILELTVFHLTQLQQQQQSATLATEAAAFKAGYSRCAREVTRFMSETKAASPDITRSLSNHLDRSMVQQTTMQTYGKQKHHGLVSKDTAQLNRFSTPLRPYDTFGSPLPEMSFNKYSPIQEGDTYSPEVTFQTMCMNPNSSSSIDFSSSYSCSSISSGESSVSFENKTPKITCDKNIDVVTIGNGKENEIGHVIKEAPWRPF